MSNSQPTRYPIRPLLTQKASRPGEPNTPVLADGVDAGDAITSPSAQTESYRDDGSDPNLLPVQRWGIVAPEGEEGDRLLKRIEPLRLLRQAQQGGQPVKIFRVPRNLQPDPTGKTEPLASWKKENLDRLDERETPFYLLFLGDLDQVSLELQQYLAGDALTGRLAFRKEEHYEAYANKVVSWEQKPSAAGQARALFYTVHDGSAATSIGYHALMKPAFAAAGTARERGELPTRELREIGTPDNYGVDQMLEQAARQEPTVLFSMSHGLGAPRGGWKSLDEQWALQGAMNLGEGRLLEASVLETQPFLPGGIWFYFACLGAGTPSRSAFFHWLHQLQQSGKYSGRLESLLASLPKQGQRPFIAALPQAVLANPKGPLAVYGHIDLAWTFGIMDRLTGRGEVVRFLEPIYQLVSGRRAGVGMKRIHNGYCGANSELTTLLDLEKDARVAGRPFDSNLGRMAHLWMVRQDLAGYMLLGDPAVRLPLAETQKASSAVPEGRVATVQGFAAEPEAQDISQPTPVSVSSFSEPAQQPPAPEALGTEAKVEAVQKLISMRLKLAQQLGISPAQLERWEQLYLQAGQKALTQEDR